MTNKRLLKNLTASILGRGLSGGLQFIFTPVYVHFLGIESYGLIGFYTIVLTTLLFLDGAVSPAVVRALAASNKSSESVREVADTFRTMEWIAISTGLVLAASLFASASWLQSRMLHAQGLSSERLIVGLRIMSIMIAAQWPSFLYGGALTGLGSQVQLNLTRGGIALIQWVGGSLLLFLAKAQVETLLAWQFICIASQTFLLRHIALSHMPKSDRKPRFSRRTLNGVWRFSIGTLIIGFTGSVLAQSDKFAVSHSSSLGIFAAYSLAFTLVSVLAIFVVQPAMTIAFPHFTRLFSTGDINAVETEYRRWTQIIVTIIAPITALLVFYPSAVLSLWVRGESPELTQMASAVPWIAVGTMLNTIMMVPFNLQLSAGWTYLSAAKNIIILPIYLPITLYGLHKFGFIFGAIMWFSVNCSYYLFEVYFMHRRLLPRIRNAWWMRDTLAPVAATTVVFLFIFLIVRSVVGSHPSVTVSMTVGVISTAISMAILGLSLRYPRSISHAILKRLRG